MMTGLKQCGLWGAIGLVLSACASAPAPPPPPIDPIATPQQQAPILSRAAAFPQTPLKMEQCLAERDAARAAGTGDFQCELIFFGTNRRVRAGWQPQPVGAGEAAPERDLPAVVFRKRSPDYGGNGHFALEPEPAYLLPPEAGAGPYDAWYIDRHCGEVICPDGVTLGQLVVSAPVVREGGSLPKQSGIEPTQEGGYRYACADNRGNVFCLYKTPDLLSEEAFGWAVKDYLDSVTVNKEDALVFLHGFNVTFNDAAMRTAQLKIDTDFGGPAFFFSWPANSSIFDYLRDQDDADLSANNFARFLRMVREVIGPERRIHLVSHSMGNRVLAQTIRELRASGDLAGEAPFVHNLVIASADIDKVLFDEWTDGRIGDFAGQTTVFTSSTDEAVFISRILRNFRRARDGKSLRPRLGVFLGNKDEPYPALIDGAVTIDTTRSRESYFDFLKPRFFLIRLITFGRELMRGIDHAQYVESIYMCNDLQSLVQGGKLIPTQRNPRLYREATIEATGETFYAVQPDKDYRPKSCRLE